MKMPLQIRANTSVVSLAALAIVFMVYYAYRPKLHSDPLLIHPALGAPMGDHYSEEQLMDMFQPDTVTRGSVGRNGESEIFLNCPRQSETNTVKISKIGVNKYRIVIVNRMTTLRQEE